MRRHGAFEAAESARHDPRLAPDGTRAKYRDPTAHDEETRRRRED